MARSIGSIDITVQANTGRLVAQLTQAGKASGKAFKKASEKEMRNLEASIELQTQEAMFEARNLRKRIEAQLAGIDLEVDFAEARAQLKEFEEQTERTQLMLNVGADLSERDMADIVADYKGFKERVEHDRIVAQLELDAEGVFDDAAVAKAALDEMGVQWEVDLSGLEAAVEQADAAKFAIERHRIQLKFDAARSLAEEMLRVEAAKEAIERDAIRWNIDFHTALTKGEAETRLFLRKERNLELGLDIHSATALAKLDAQILDFEATHDVDLDAEVHANRARLALELKKIQALADAGLRDFDVNVDVEVTKASKAAADALIVSNMKQTGKEAGGGLGDAFSTRLKAIAGAVVLLAEPAAVALEGLLGGALSVVSSGFSALAGAAALAGPALAGVGGVVGTLVVGMQDLGGALDGDVESFDKLTPSAKAFAGAVDDIGPAWDRVQRVVQQHLFAGLGEELRELSNDVLPEVEDGLVGMADDLNTFFKDLSGVAQDMDFEGIFEGLQPAVKDILNALVSLVEATEPFLKAAAPAAQALADSFEEGAQSLGRMISAGEDSGNLTEFLVEGVESLKQWGNLLTDVGDLLFTVFEAGKASGDDMVASLGRIVEQWDNWLESDAGQDAMEDFFITTSGLMSDMVPILKGLAGFFDNLITDDAIDRFGDLAESLGDILPVLGSMLEIVGRVRILNTFVRAVDLLADAIEPNIPIIQDLADVIGDSLAANLEAIAPAIPPLVDAIAELVVAFTPVVADLLEPSIELFAALAPIVTAAAEAFEALVGPLFAVVGPLAKLMNLPTRGLAAGLDLVTGGLGRLAEGLNIRDPAIEATFEDTVTGAENASWAMHVLELAMNAADEASEANAEANTARADSYIAVTDAIDAHIASEKVHNEELKKERDAAFDAYQEELKLADATREGAAAAADAAGFSRDLAEEIIDLGDAARTAADNADALRNSFDLLIGPGVDVQESFSNIQQAIDDFDEAIKGGQEAIDARADTEEKLADARKEDDPERRAALEEEARLLREQAEAAEAAAISLDLSTQAGRDNAELLRGHAEEIINWAAAQIAAGESADAVTANVAMARETLIQQADAFGKTREEAESYVDVLLGTPEFLNTVIQTPGLFDALLNAEDLTLLYDDLGNPVITEFEALGLDPALASSEEFKTLLEQLNVLNVAPTVDATGAIVADETIQAVATSTEALDQATGEPQITVPPTAEEQLAALQLAVTNLDASVASPTITIPFIDTNITRVNELDAAIDGLTDKTVTITVNTRGGLPAGFDLPNLPGGMAGELISFPTVRRVGERGYREAIVPLDLPLSRVDPSVRDLAALLRGAIKISTPSGKTINLTQHITPASADPGAVATQIINRAAALANR